MVAATACIPDLPPADDDSTDTGTFPSETGTGSLAEGSVGPDDSGATGSEAAGGDSSSGLPCGDGYIDLGGFEQCDPPSPGKCNPDCTMQCAGGMVWGHNNHCYVLIDASATDLSPSVGTANGWCQSNGLGGHVVTFASDDEFRAVADYALDAGLGQAPFWVGLLDVMHMAHYTSINDYEPGWSAACPGCYAHLADGATTFPSGGTGEYCLEAFASAQASSWRALKCSGAAKTNIVCEREPNAAQSTPCDAGETCIDLQATYAHKRYVYHDVPSSPGQAAQSCAAEGGRLVVLRSSEEREQLWYQLQGLATKPQAFWIGLSLTNTPTEAGVAQWTWEDGMPAQSYPSEWARSEPFAVEAGDAARAYLAHLWDTSDDTLAHDETPSTPLPFVCEIDKP
jgi:hypothetical protein